MRAPALLALTGLAALFAGGAPRAEAAAPITYRYEHHLFTVDPDNHPQWRGGGEAWLFEGQPIHPLAAWRADGDAVPALPEGVQRVQIDDWDRAAIRATLEQKVSSVFNRPAGRVTISRDASGKITFEGVGLT